MSDVTLPISEETVFSSNAIPDAFSSCEMPSEVAMITYSVVSTDDPLSSVVVFIIRITVPRRPSASTPKQ